MEISLETAVLKSAAMNGAACPDPIPGLAVCEGESLVLTLTLADPVTFAITVDVDTGDDTAIAGEDYVSVSTTVTFAANEQRASATFPTIDDNINEPEEVFLITLSNPSEGANIGTGTHRITLYDKDPAPAISIADASAYESAEAMSFPITLDAPSAQAIRVVAFTSSQGTATAGTDFTEDTAELTFDAGQTSITFVVVIADDGVDESDETFTVVLASPTGGATFGRDFATGTILDGASTPALSIADNQVAEDAGPLVLAVTLSPASSGTVTVDYATADGSATEPSDYTSTSGTLTFAPGETSMTISVPLIDDELVEGDETFSVQLSAAVGADLADASATATIINDDVLPAVALTIADASASENAGPLVLAVTLSPASSGNVTVDYATADGSATEPSDYTSTSGTLTFAPGETSMTISVPLIDDELVEGDETFSVVLSGENGADLANASATATIINDDVLPAVALTIADGRASENAGPLVLAVTLSPASSGDVTVDYATADGSATEPSDYTSTSGTLTFSAGETSMTISVPLIDDELVEGDETFSVQLSAAVGADLADASATATIINDDVLPAVALTIADASASENAGPLVLAVTLSPASSGNVTVDYATADGSATEPSDYTSTSGTLTFSAGETSMTISVPLIDDELVEGDETFSVVLSGENGADLANASATATIINDDVLPAVALTIADASASENAGPLVLAVTLSPASSGNVTVDYATADGSATEPSDYTSTSGTLTFSAGETSMTISVPLIDDELVEGDETFSVVLSGENGADLANASATATIINDDVLPAVAFASGSATTVNECAGDVSFTVVLEPSSAEAVAVDYATSDGTASASEDYEHAAGTINFGIGETQKTVIVPILADNTSETAETFDIALSNPVNATLGSNNSLSVSIENAACQIDMTIADASASEDAGTMTFAVTLSLQATETITVSYATADGSATQALDYTSTSGTLTFTAGETSKTISVPLIDDELVEGDETFSVQLSAAVGADLADASATATIINDDGLPAVAFASGSATTVNECAGDVSFTVVLEPGSAEAVAVDYATSDGTASASEDYEHAAGTINFGIGETEKTVIVPILADNTSETAETFDIALSNPVNATLGSNNSLSVSIENAACQIDMTIADASASEDAGTMTIAVTLSLQATETITVDYATADGSATQALDYTSTSGTLTFTAGETSKTISVPLIDDELVEGDETFSVQLSAAVGADLADASATATIINDDGLPAVAFASGSATTVNECAGDVSFTVVLEPSSADAVAVDYATSDGTASASEDYEHAAGTINFGIGETQKTVIVPILADNTSETAETFDIALSNPVNATLGSNNSLSVSIENAACQIDMTIADASASEDAGTMTFAVTLSFQATETITVDYATADGSATQALDYTSTSGTLTFTAGETSKTISVPIIDDELVEGNETFSVQLSAPVGADLADASATATIINDDGLPAVAFASGSATTVSECAGDVSFTVVLEPGSDDAVAVAYATSDGTANADEDYEHAAGTINFGVGETERTVIVPILADNISENVERFYIALSDPVNATLGFNDRLSVSITNAACQIEMAIADASASEGAGTMTFAVTLSLQTSEIITVGYATADATAKAGLDYSASSGQLTFNARDTEQTISVPILDDAHPELNETFTLTLSGISNTDFVKLATGSATGTIRDDDGVRLSIADASVAEDSGPMRFPVSLSAPLTEEMQVDYTTSDGTAEAASDYTATSGTLMFGVGETVQTILVPIQADTEIEVDEGFSVTLSGLSVAAITLLRETATGTIQNDDFPSVSVADTVVVENAGHATFTVKLSEASKLAATLRYSTSDGTAEAGADFLMSGGALTFEPGVTKRTIDVPVLEDELDEEDEAFTFSLEDPVGLVLADGAATGTIVDNDDPPTLSISDATAAESEGSMAFTVRLDAASGTIVSMQFATSDGTAKAGTDYEESAGTVTFKPGELTQTVSVAVLEDAVDEDDETLEVVLSDPVNVSVIDGTAIGTITDDDGPPGLFIADATASEGDELIAFAVRLDAKSQREVTAQFATSDGSAKAETDYTAQMGTITFVAGDTTQMVTVPVLNDFVAEDLEDFTVALTSPVNATIKDGGATGRISDDDTKGVTVSNTALEILEGSSKAYGVALATQPTANVNVDVGGIAGDVSVDKTRLAFTPDTWNVAQTVTVLAAEDDDAVPDDVVTLTHSATGGDYDGLPGGTVAVTIRENDATGVIIEPTVLAIQEGSSESYTVILTSKPTGQVTVSMTADLSSTDVLVNQSVLAFSPENWDEAQSVVVTALDDADATTDDPISLPHTVGGADYDGVHADAVLLTITEDETTWDAISVDWLARFGRTVGSQAVTTIGSRLTDVTPSPASVRLGNSPQVGTGFGPESGSTGLGQQRLHPGRLLRQSSFDVSSTLKSDDSVDRFSTWGRVEDMRFMGTGTDYDINGDVVTGFVGTDYERNRFLVGLGASYAHAAGGYDFGIGTDGQGSITTSLISVYPYARYRFTSRILGWGLIGYGRGSLTLTEDVSGMDEVTDVTMRMAGMGAQGSLVSASNAGGLDLVVKSDAFVVRAKSEDVEALAQSYGDVLKIRLAVEGSYRIRIGTSSAATPSLEIAARQDAGDAETGTGMEIVGALRFTGGGLTFEAAARRLMIQRDRTYEEWGLGGLLRFTSGTAGRGLTLAVRPTAGRSSTGADLLWMSRDMPRPGSVRASPPRRLATEVGYGMGVAGNSGSITPYAAIELSGARSRAVRVGGRWRMGSSLSVHLEGGRRTGYFGAASHQVLLRGVLDW